MSRKEGPQQSGNGAKGWIIGIAVSLPFLLVGGGIAWLWVASAGPPDQILHARSLLTLPDPQASASLSPDGTRIAYSLTEGPDAGLCVQFTDDSERIRVSDENGIEGPPAWSPDGESLAYAELKEGCRLYRVAAAGGSRIGLGDCLSAPRDLAWSPDGRWLAFSDQEDSSPRRIYLLDLENDRRKVLTDPAPNSLGDRYPAFSPDGSRLAFRRAAGAHQHDLFVAPLPDGTPLQRLTFDKGSHIRGLDWMPQGDEIVFSSDRGGRPALWRISVTARKLQRMSLHHRRLTQPRTARSKGRLVYKRERDAVGLWSVGLDGRGALQGEPQRLDTAGGSEFHPRLSSDGRRLAFTSDRSGDFDVWTRILSEPEASRQTELQNALVDSPTWSAQGDRLVFDAYRQGSADLFLTAVGARSSSLLTLEASDEVNPAFSRDDRYLYFSSNRRNGWQIWKMPSNGGRAVQVTLRGGYAAQEDARRDYLYYAKLDEAGIWRIPIHGGEEQRVLDAPGIGDWGNWVLRPQGVYFVTRNPASVAFFSFEKGQVHSILKPPQDIPLFDPTLEGSEDERLLIFGQVEQRQAEIMLVGG